MKDDVSKLKTEKELKEDFYNLNMAKNSSLEIDNQERLRQTLSFDL